MSTLAQLRQRVRYNVGEPFPGGVNSSRFYDVSINNNLNEAYSHYQQWLWVNGEGDLAIVAPIDLVANQAQYPLPADWVKTHKLERVITFGTRPLDKYERYQASNVTIAGNNGDAYLPTYRYLGRNLVLEPYPTFGEIGGLVHEYYALKAPMVLDTDTPDAGLIEPWQSMLVIWATIAELEQKEAIGGVADTSTFRDRLQQMEKSYLESMNNRSEARDEVEAYGLDYDNNFNYFR